MAQLDEIVGKSNIQGVLDLDKALIALDETFMKVLKSSKDTSAVLNTQAASFSQLKTVQEQTTQQAQKLGEAEKQAEKIAKEQAAAVASLEKQRQAAYQAAAKQEAKERELAAAIQMEVKSIGDAEKQNKALLEAKKKLNLTTEEGKKKNQEYNAILNKNTEFIRQNSDAATKQRMNIGNYGSALKGLGTKLIGLGAAFGASIGAMQAFKGIIFSTQTTADAFEKQIGGIKEATGFFARSIATLDFSNLLTGLREAYNEGKRYAGALDEIADRQRALGIQKLDIEGQILEQRLIAKNRQLDLKDREAALKEIVRLEELKLSKTLEVTGEDLNNELQHAEIISKLRKEEIADFVKNYDQYSAKVSEGGGLRAYLDSLVETQSQMVGDQLVITKNYDKQRAAVAKLTDTEKENLALYEKSQLITDPIRDKIAAAMKNEIQARNEQKSGLETIVTLYNRLYKELIKGEDEYQDAIAVAADKRKEEEAKRLDDLKKAREANAIDEIETIRAKEFAITEIVIGEMKLRDKTAEELDANQRERDAATYQYRLEKAQEYTAAVQQIGQNLLDFNQFLINTETQKLEQAKAYELQLAGDNAVKKELIEKKYEKEAAKLRTRQAKQDKAQAMFAGIMNVAQAVTKAMTAGPLIGQVLAGIVAALGAIQVGIIASTPIPQFWKGTKSAPDGLISVAERGQELIQTRSGKVLMANRPTLLSGMKGARIYSNKETEAILKARSAGYDSPELRRVLNDNNDKLIKAIQNKREIHITPAKNSRVIERDGVYFKNYYRNKLG